MMLIKLAWRNLWRNRRRSLITISSITMAVLLSNVMVSINEGVFGYMLDNMTRTFLGHVQIHAKGYWEEQGLDRTMEQNDAMAAGIVASEHVLTVAPRLQTFGLAAFGNRTLAAQVVGVDLLAEQHLMDLHSHTVEGRPIGTGLDEVMIGNELAQLLKMNVGDTLVIIGQGFHGSGAAGKYKVVGTLKMNAPSLNRSLVVMPLSDAQYLFSCEHRLSSYTLIIDRPDAPQAALNHIFTVVDTTVHEVMTWSELMPEIVQMKTTKIAGSYIYVGILYLIAAFGVFSTILMMMAERSFELGVMLSVGMARTRLTGMVLIEVFLLTLLGVAAGTGLAYPMLWYMKENPVRLTGEAAKAYQDMGFDPLIVSSTAPDIFIQNGVVLMVLSCFIALYPAIVLYRLNPIKAMRK